jgi:hypothetical protein
MLVPCSRNHSRSPEVHSALPRRSYVAIVNRDTTSSELIYYNPRLKRIEDVCQHQKARRDTLARPKKFTASKRASEGDSGHRFTSRKLAEHLESESSSPILVTATNAVC